MTAEESKPPPAIFAVFGIMAALLMLGRSAGDATAYTDGILQLTVLENKTGLYPPLYGLLASLLSFMFSKLHTAGQLISTIGYTFTFFLVHLLGIRVGGKRAGFIAALLFAVSPLALRWGSQVMSDALYMAISTGAMLCMVEAWTLLRTGEKPESAKYLAGAIALGAFATLTRYQGILLAPLLALVAILYIRRFRTAPKMALAAGLLWLLVPAWMWYNGFVHQDQFAERTTGHWLTGFTAWLNTFESFILISPYYFGYPIVAAALVGIFYVKRTAQVWYARPAAVLWGAYGLMILILQARFGSFQYRYMLPLLPMVVALAGVGFSVFETAFAHRPKLPRWVLILSVIYLAFFSLCVLILQGRPYQDQYNAAEYIKENVPAGTALYSNERYGNFTKLGSVKLSYWTGRPVKILLSPDQPLEPGAVVVLGTAYGGNDAVGAYMQALSARHNLEPLSPEPFRSRIVPLMDDIMVNPMFNQNPMGWVMRYVPQEFATQIFRVTPRTTTGVPNGQ